MDGMKWCVRNPDEAYVRSVHDSALENALQG